MPPDREHRCLAAKAVDRCRCDHGFACALYGYNAAVLYTNLIEFGFDRRVADYSFIFQHLVKLFRLIRNHVLYSNRF